MAETVLAPSSFFDLNDYKHRSLFAEATYVWEALAGLPAYLESVIRPNIPDSIPRRSPLEQTLVLWQGRAYRDGFEVLGGDVTKGSFRVRIGEDTTHTATVLFAGCVLWDDRIQLGPGAVVEPGALVKGPTMVGAHTEIRQGAYIRGKCLIGDRCVVGHTTEVKTSIMLDDAKAGHFAYVGDSILGKNTNLGAGTKLANLKITGTTVRINLHGKMTDTGCRKLGAILGDRTELGCNSVTNPGALLGRNCLVVPLTSVRAGYYEDESRLS